MQNIMQTFLTLSITLSFLKYKGTQEKIQSIHLLFCYEFLVVSLQAANLYERTVKGIARCVVAAPAPSARTAARNALLALLVSLDAWAGPLKVSHSLRNRFPYLFRLPKPPCTPAPMHCLVHVIDTLCRNL